VTVQPEWVNGDDFTALSPHVTKALGGDFAAAATLARIRFRTRLFGYEHDGRMWWRASAEDLASDLGASVKQVRRALGVLERAGMLDREQHALDGAYDRTMSYSINYATPPPGVETTDVPPRADRPSPEGTTDVPPRANDDPPSRADVPIRSLRSNKKSPAPRDSDFQAFWDAYPRRVGIKAARAEFTTATAKAPPEQIIAAARAYAASRDLPEPRFIPHPSTWLAAERWTDDTTKAPPPPRERCRVYGHEYYPAYNCPGCAAETKAAG